MAVGRFRLHSVHSACQQTLTLRCTSVQKAIKGNVQNGLYLAESVGELQRQLEFEETRGTAGNTLEILFSNNAKLVKQISEEQLTYFTRALSMPSMQDRRHVNLRFLKLLCSCCGTGITGNQDPVVNWLEMANADNLIPKTLSDEKGAIIQVSCLYVLLPESCAKHLRARSRLVCCNTKDPALTHPAFPLVAFRMFTDYPQGANQTHAP